ncbi:MAG: nicotinate-nucleotide adenylyltransferase [Myxococcales bacterium]|nr:nicotinate-nucleotide adenylyltransferase [Myxococcales bacterium]
MRRIGLFGGTFNPIHLGHLRVAEEVREAQALDRVIFIPAADPPHKNGLAIIPVAHRLAMTRLAVTDDPSFAVSDFEANRAEKSFSLYTIRHFRETTPAARLFFIIGADAFAEITTWHRWEEVIREVSFVVMTRPGSRIGHPAEALPKEWAGRIETVSESLYHVDNKEEIIFQPVTSLEISSSDIRRRRQEGGSIRFLVSPAVEDYIRVNHLYE